MRDNEAIAREIVDSLQRINQERKQLVEDGRMSPGEDLIIQAVALVLRTLCWTFRNR